MHVNTQKHTLTNKHILNLGFLQNRWAEMFECIVAVASTVEVISNGSGGSRNGALLLVCSSITINVYIFLIHW